MNDARSWFVIATVLVPIGVLVFVPPFAQPLWYHDFADQRCICGIPHLWNVVSNLPFVVVGVWGVTYLLGAREFPGFADARERWLYVLFFVAIALTGVGSAYYHADPNNARLLWDRLPLALAIMTLVAIVIAERIDRRAGLWLLLPLLFLGGGSVVYWHVSELWGRGDLRPYLLAQLYPLLALPLILLLFPPRYTRTADLYGALAFYIAAKLLEILDKQVYSQGQIVSGHTIKHLLAAVSAYLVLHMIQRRQTLATKRQQPVM